MQEKLLTNWWCWATRWTVFYVTSSPPSITKWVWIALSTNNLCGALAAADNSQFFRILLPSHITGTWAYTKGSVTISDKLSSKLQVNGRHKKLILPGPKGVQYQKGETAKKPPTKARFSSRKNISKMNKGGKFLKKLWCCVGGRAYLSY